MTCSFSKEFLSGSFTQIENSFIAEYLPISSGNAVKVYLYGLYLCNNSGEEQSLSSCAEQLKIPEAEILDCFKYWEEFGLVSILSEEPLTVSYLPIKQSYSSKPRKIKAEKYTDFTKALQLLLPDRMISTGEYSEYFNIMETYSIKPNAMLMIVKYCVDRQGNDVGYRYIAKVAKDFGEHGNTTVEKVEQKLSAYVLRTGEITKILKALSLRRQPEVEDLKYLEKWTSDLEFEVDNIVYAASKIKKGSMDKLNEFLLELYSMKSFSKQEISAFMDKKQQIYDLAIKINRALSVYVEVLDTEIDTFINKWLSYGFEGDALLLIASHSFMIGKNTLQDMDKLVESLYEKGYVSLSGVGDYFEEIKKQDGFISKMLLTCGVNRKPTAWDRENLSMWKNWNFSDEMILEAAKLSSGKTSPIAYMQGILSKWKNSGTFSLSGVESFEDKQNLSDGVSNEAYNLEYERRRGVAISKAQKNAEKAMGVEGFPEVYSRLNSIEKDLALAEINENKEAYENFEKEKAELKVLMKKLLASVSLTEKDLTPRYFCEKCKDTGYVGSKRCDCFDKYK